ncbi:MAG: carbohydrate ABC transporter permease, partial [Anaerolineae bacterium]
MSIFKARTLEEREARLAYFFIVPTFLVVVGLVIFPAFFSIWISFHDVDLGSLNDVFHTPFVGLKNYIKVWNDFEFKWQDIARPGAAATSIFYSFVSTIFTIIIGLAASLLLNRRFRGRGLIRAVFLFSYIAPVISVAYIWRWLLDPTISGVANWLLIQIGLISAPVSWLGTRGLALLMVILFQGWRYFPFAMLM